MTERPGDHSAGLRARRAPALRLCRDLVAGVVIYFVVPLGGNRDDPVLWIRIVVVIVGFVLVTRSIVRRMTREIRGDAVARRTEGLLVSVVAGVLFSAAADYVVATVGPGQFEGLATRIDALYFALTTLVTVGYGDVHPVGQLARALVSAQMILNVGVVTIAAGLVVRGVTDRLREGPPREE
jgi:voltage-gated potassium channel